MFYPVLSQRSFGGYVKLGFATRNEALLLDFTAGQGLIMVSHGVNTMPAAADERLADGRAVTGFFMVRQTFPVSEGAFSNLVVKAASSHRPRSAHRRMTRERIARDKSITLKDVSLEQHP